MKIETWLNPNCSESSWRITGPKEELVKIRAEFKKRVKGDDNIEWIGDTLLLQTTDQQAAGEYYQGTLLANKKIKVYQDDDRARDCCCGGDWCPPKEYKEPSNVDLLRSGQVKLKKVK